MPSALIIEDDPSLRRVLTINLARRGLSVAEADSVASAEEVLAAAAELFDIILLDINLPDESGWELLRHLETRRRLAYVRGASSVPHLPVIVLTAMSPLVRRIEEFRPAAVLIKPFPIAALLRGIERVLGQPLENTGAAEVPHGAHPHGR